MPDERKRNRGIGSATEAEADLFTDRVFGGSGSYRTLAPGPQPQSWGVTQTSNTGVVLGNNTSQAVYASASSVLAK
jgi:hypothetical protein